MARLSPRQVEEYLDSHSEEWEAIVPLSGETFDPTSLVEVDYEPLDAVPDLGTAADEGMPLVHDDVLDGADKRRRVASVNRRWDNQVAVLLGDFLYARAFARSTRLSSRLCSQLLSVTTQRICAGEIDEAGSRMRLNKPDQGQDTLILVEHIAADDQVEQS